MSSVKRFTPATSALLRTFGAEVRRRRHAQDLSLEALGVRADLTANFIGTIENGKREASLSTVLKLASGLGCKPGQLFDADKMTAAAHEAGTLFDAINTSEQRKAVLKLLRALEQHYMRPAKRPPRRRAK